MTLNVIKYVHHNREVYVAQELQGKHREHCLCYSCSSFKPNLEENCEIAKAIYQNCVKYDLVTPVWECPKFIPLS